jgi:hypothetical protein
MQQYSKTPNPDELRTLDEQIQSAKNRYERYSDMPRPAKLVTGYVPPVIGFLSIFPAFAVLKAMSYVGFSSTVQIIAGIVAYLIMASGTAIYVRNKLIKNPKSKWRYLQNFY